MPDGRFGWVTHAYNPTTGEFLSLQLILNDVPARTVEVSPGKQVPLTDYLAIRAMRLLNISVSQLRTVRIFDVETYGRCCRSVPVRRWRRPSWPSAARTPWYGPAAASSGPSWHLVPAGR